MQSLFATLFMTVTVFLVALATLGDSTQREIILSQLVAKNKLSVQPLSLPLEFLQKKTLPMYIPI